MKEEIPKCKDCGQPMLELGGIGKSIQIGEFDPPAIVNGKPAGMSLWRQTGIREQKLYQCPECKEVKIY